MGRQAAVITAVIVVLLTGMVAAVAVTMNGDWSDRRDGMMWSRSYDGADGQRDRRPSMVGSMHGTRVDDEQSYLAEMIVHHEEAVAAAQELQRSPRAEMREFGEAVVASQTAQIDQMRQWLADWYPDVSTRVDYRPMMRDLTDLSGDRLDQVFLEDMIGHHMAAVMMSQQLLMGGVADHEEVEQLARTIREEQHTEIFQMQQWLADWFGGGWGSGMPGGMPWMFGAR